MPRQKAPDKNLEAEYSRKTSQRSDASPEHKRSTTLYDSIAGRVTAEGFLPTHQSTSKYRDSTSHSTQPIPPEKALFRFKGRKYEGENDPYWAHRYLTADQPLPDSDLLKAIHTYASDFYARVFGTGAMVDYRSMDETALLCCGILMEEMADEVLGETGDLALTEGERVAPDISDGGSSEVRVIEQESPEDAPTVRKPMVARAQKERVSPIPRKSKKRKTKHYTDNGVTSLAHKASAA